MIIPVIIIKIIVENVQLPKQQQVVAGDASVAKGGSSGGKAGGRCCGRKVRATQLRIKGLWQPRPGSTIRTSHIQLSGPGGAFHQAQVNARQGVATRPRDGIHGGVEGKFSPSVW